jgi:hypothetical protein
MGVWEHLAAVGSFLRSGLAAFPKGTHHHDG